MTQTLQLESSGGSMGLYEAEPGGTAWGAIVVLQEAFGVNDHIQDVCRRFAAEGYRAVAPHLFHRTGDPVIDYEDMQTVIEHMMQLSLDGLEADLDASSRLPRRCRLRGAARRCRRVLHGREREPSGCGAASAGCRGHVLRRWRRRRALRHARARRARAPVADALARPLR